MHLYTTSPVIDMPSKHVTITLAPLMPSEGLPGYDNPPVPQHPLNLVLGIISPAITSVLQCWHRLTASSSCCCTSLAVIVTVTALWETEERAEPGAAAGSTYTQTDTPNR